MQSRSARARVEVRWRRSAADAHGGLGRLIRRAPLRDQRVVRQAREGVPRRVREVIPQPVHPEGPRDVAAAARAEEEGEEPAEVRTALIPERGEEVGHVRARAGAAAATAAP
jgi:hypothetical protein